MPILKVTDTVIEPVTLDEVKGQLRIDGVDDDARLTPYIGAARQEVEHILQRTLIDTTYELWRDGFPDALRLERPKVREVVWVKYIDSAGVEQTLDPADYTLDAVTEPNYVVPAYGKAWPATRCEINSVNVRYRAGYGIDLDGPADAQRARVPPAIRAWLLLRIQQMALGCDAESAAAMRAHPLLDPWRVWR